MAVAKPAGGWTYEDLVRFPDGKRYEIIDGGLYELPPPSWVHQLVIMNLVGLLRPWATSIGGALLTAPLDVFLGTGRPVQPDVLLLGPRWRDLMTSRGVEGAPELIVEVLSPSNPGHDRIAKRNLYARAGVREYWLVSPEAAVIEVLVLREGAYELHVRAGGGEPVTSTVFPDGPSFPASAASAGIDPEA
jgi:Uma2 family endonuclease